MVSPVLCSFFRAHDERLDRFQLPVRKHLRPYPLAVYREYLKSARITSGTLPWKMLVYSILLRVNPSALALAHRTSSPRSFRVRWYTASEGNQKKITAFNKTWLPSQPRGLTLPAIALETDGYLVCWLSSPHAMSLAAQEPKSGTSFMYEWAVNALMVTCSHLERLYGRRACQVSWRKMFSRDRPSPVTAETPVIKMKEVFFVFDPSRNGQGRDSVATLNSLASPHSHAECSCENVNR